MINVVTITHPALSKYKHEDDAKNYEFEVLFWHSEFVLPVPPPPQQPICKVYSRLGMCCLFELYLECKIYSKCWFAGSSGQTIWKVYFKHLTPFQEPSLTNCNQFAGFADLAGVVAVKTGKYISGNFETLNKIESKTILYVFFC